jgi:PPM family protein phosphatase
MNGSMRTLSMRRSAGGTNPGLQREVNEDRFHIDASRGLFIVVDGVGGQAAGGKAADIGLTMLRKRLERETGPVADRVREAIAIANNEIHRVAGLRPEWSGMACVLTVVVLDETRAIVGHVGDTRLYKLRDGRIDKITRDHSPVGEREDSREISELEAMRHPRRNEVYRDVGSEPHQPADPDFIDLLDIPFEPDAALLVCSDGLTDLIDSSSIQQIVGELAGHPDEVVKTLIEAANTAGGRDNISVVYLEGDRFASQATHSGSSFSEITQRLPSGPANPDPARALDGSEEEAGHTRGIGLQRTVRIALIALSIIVIALAVARVWPYWRISNPHAAAPSVSGAVSIVVLPTESISAALQRAGPGSTVIVEPGEYHETLILKDGVRVISRIPRGATIRLPGTASEADPAVVASAVTGAELVGFRIVGDAATPLGTGVLVSNAELSIVDVEVTGAANVAIDINSMSRANVVASDIHDNPGAALAIRSDTSPRIAHNVFARNGLSERVKGSFVIDDNMDAQFSGNVFHGVGQEAFKHLAEGARGALGRDNWFVESQDLRTRTAIPPSRRGR